MRKAATVMVVLSAIIVLSFSSSHAFCLSQAGKIVKMELAIPTDTLISVVILQNSTTNKFWRGNLQLTSPLMQLLSTAMAGGLTVTIQSTATTCPASFQAIVGTTVGTMVNMGYINYIKLEK